MAIYGRIAFIRASLGQDLSDAQIRTYKVVTRYQNFFKAFLKI